MKTSIITIFILGLVLSWSFVFCQQTDLDKNKFSGSIKNIRVKSFTIPKHGVNIGKKTNISDKEIDYNIEGFKQKSSEYKSGELFTFTTHNYTIKNVLVSSEEFNADGSPYLTVTYKSNKDSTEIEAKYNRDVQKSYDNQRQSIEIEFESYYKKLFTRILYINDFKGYTLQEKYYTEDSTLAYKLMYKYDYKYNRVEIKYYNSSGHVSWRKKIKYNTDGNISEIKLFESNRMAMLSKFEYEFDQYRNWTKREETKKLYDNFFSDNLNDNTVITYREIIYY
ncbi:MAG: hypothetical protein QM503_04090 [Bacteroidota bacterium]